MFSCWALRPDARPKIASLSEKLLTLLTDEIARRPITRDVGAAVFASNVRFFLPQNTLLNQLGSYCDSYQQSSRCNEIYCAMAPPRFLSLSGRRRFLIFKALPDFFHLFSSTRSLSKCGWRISYSGQRSCVWRLCALADQSWRNLTSHHQSPRLPICNRQ